MKKLCVHSRCSVKYLEQFQYATTVRWNYYTTHLQYKLQLLGRAVHGQAVGLGTMGLNKIFTVADGAVIKSNSTPLRVITCPVDVYSLLLFYSDDVGCRYKANRMLVYGSRNKVATITNIISCSSRLYSTKYHARRWRLGCCFEL